VLADSAVAAVAPHIAKEAVRRAAPIIQNDAIQTVAPEIYRSAASNILAQLGLHPAYGQGPTGLSTHNLYKG